MKQGLFMKTRCRSGHNINLIRGSYLETTVDELKLGAKKPAMPYSDTRLLNILSHTLWFLPNVASCFAMSNLLKQKQNVFYHNYKINVCDFRLQLPFEYRRK